MSIRVRLLAMLLIGLAIVLTAGGAAVHGIARSNLVRQFDDGLSARAHSVASLVTCEPGRIIVDSGEGPARMLAGTFFEIRTAAGDVLKRSDNLAGTALPARDVVEDEIAFDDLELPGAMPGRAAWFGVRPRAEEADDDDDEEDPDEDVFVTADASTAPELLLVIVASDRGPVDDAMATLFGALIGVGGVLGLTVAGLVVTGVRWGLVPLDQLRKQISSVNERTISEQFDGTDAPRELEPIYRELNRLLDRVKRTIERERTFADAAAHELRTPLSELRIAAEVALRWPDVDRATEALEEVLDVGREMERLVESLLLISRGHANGINGAEQEIPVATIVRGCLDRAADSISDKRLQLTLDLDDCGPLRAPRDAAEIIIRNLIENAVQYTPRDGHITIRGEGRTNGSPPSLTIENDPVPLTETDLPRLFEPFWRAEGSRSDRQHAGLGLAVIHQIAAAIGLRVDAGLAGDRLRMRVSGARD